MSTSAFPSGAAEERHVSIPIGSIHLQGSLVVPEASGMRSWVQSRSSKILVCREAEQWPLGIALRCLTARKK
jgi:hypothetical protein